VANHCAVAFSTVQLYIQQQLAKGMSVTLSLLYVHRLVHCLNSALRPQDLHGQHIAYCGTAVTIGHVDCSGGGGHGELVQGTGAGYESRECDHCD
jgi:hypothetical protein